MDNPDALRKYYNLLLSVIRVIVSVVFVRGLHNEQTLEQTRFFLAENRSSMVGIFKRIANVGGRGVNSAAPEGIDNTLIDLAKSYMALITATDFLEVCLPVEYCLVSELQKETKANMIISFFQFEDQEVKQTLREGFFS